MSMTWSTTVALLALLTISVTQAQKVVNGGVEVAFAAPALNSTRPYITPPCTEPCYVVQEPRFPFPTCRAECNPDVCSRGYAVYKSFELCCSPGVAFSDGCSSRPSECWVVESYRLKTCVRDDRKCMQGYGVYANKSACCAAGAAFPDGCSNVTLAAEPCYVPDIYYPVRLCRASQTLCRNDSGVQTFPSKDACCSPGSGAFGEQGCSRSTPPVPCWQVQYAATDRLCTRTADVDVCYRGWGVFASQEICCTPGVGFSEGCTKSITATPQLAQLLTANETAATQPAAQGTAAAATFTATAADSDIAATQPASVEVSTTPLEPGDIGK